MYILLIIEHNDDIHLKITLAEACGLVFTTCSCTYYTNRRGYSI